MYTKFHTGLLCMGMALMIVSGSLMANSPNDGESVVNYSYAVVFGTGAYQVNDQKAFIFRVPFTHRVREASPERHGIQLLLPTLAGFYDYDYDRIARANTPGDAATLSFVPGMELEYLINERWRLKPYGQIGMGRDLKNNENALIYVAGVNSHYSIPSPGKTEFALGNMLAITGFDPDDGNSQSMGILGVGIDMLYPWGVHVFGKATNLATHLIYYLYLDNPGFEQGDNRTETVRGEFEWGLALDFRKPRKLPGMELDRIGLGFRYGDNIKGIRLVTRFPF